MSAYAKLKSIASALAPMKRCRMRWYLTRPARLIDVSHADAVAHSSPLILSKSDQRWEMRTDSRTSTATNTVNQKIHIT